MARVLSQKFFERPTLEVARDLIGKTLIRRYRGKEIRATVVEVEAYDGYRDKASHAHHGKTARNTIMFGEAGVWYVYFVYGMHWMLNIVTGPRGYPAAILIRGAATEDGIHLNGPGKLTRALHISKKENDAGAVKTSGLWIEERRRVPHRNIIRMPRVGVSYAGEWAKKPYRFVLKSHRKIVGVAK